MRYYGEWAGNPTGRAEDPVHCVAEVPWRSVLFHQCGRQRGHGPSGEFCKQHAAMLAAGRHVNVPDHRERVKP